MAKKLSIEERVKIRLGDFWYIADDEARERVRQEIVDDDAKVKKKEGIKNCAYIFHNGGIINVKKIRGKNE